MRFPTTPSSRWSLLMGAALRDNHAVTNMNQRLDRARYDKRDTFGAICCGLACAALMSPVHTTMRSNMCSTDVKDAGRRTEWTCWNC